MMIAVALNLILFLPPGMPVVSAQSVHDSTQYFQSENCRACHEAIRDDSKKNGAPTKEAPPFPATPGETYDVVVVGGGPSGLTAAYLLKDLKVLVLEKEQEAGGHVRRQWWDGRPYSVAAVYMDKPSGLIEKIFRELNLSPVKIPKPMDAFSSGGRIILDPWRKGIEELASLGPDNAQLRKLWKDLHAMDQRGVFEGPEKSTEAARYEKMLLGDLLVRNYGESAAHFGDRVSSDWYGAGAREVSAWMGLLSLFGESEGSYTFEGGLGAVSEALMKALHGRVMTGALVVHALASTDSVHVVYQSGGTLRSVTAKTVIMATPSHVTRRVVQGLPPDKERALSQVHFSTYVVAILRFKKPVWEKSYALWSNETLFTELTFHDWGFRGNRPPNEPQIAAAYIPMGSDSARNKLLNTSDEEIKKQVLMDLDKILPGSSALVEGIRVIRWGHAMPIFAPGYISQIKPILQKPAGRIFFAGQDLEMPFMEGAFTAGARAAQGVRAYLQKSAVPSSAH